jgi:hypothetical protein
MQVKHFRGSLSFVDGLGRGVDVLPDASPVVYQRVNEAG